MASLYIFWLLGTLTGNETDLTPASLHEKFHSSWLPSGGIEDQEVAVVNCKSVKPWDLTKFCMFTYLIADIFGISDHNLMYSQEAVEAPEGSTSPDQAAIEARVSI